MEVLLDTCGRRGYLLLIYLFILKAEASCPKPQEGENIVLTNEALLMNDFPDGAVATLECANGYENQSGLGVIRCISGIWTEPDLICRKKNCGLPKEQLHMNFDISQGTLFGAVMKVTCDKGYQIFGASYRHCYSTGWSGKSKCNMITCKKPAEVTNGKSLWSSQEDPKYQDIVHFVCNEGYTLVGQDSITCSEAGEYDSQPPECRGVATEATSTTKTITPTPPTPTPAPTPTQAVSTSTASAATSTAHRDKTITTSETPAVSPSLPGGRDIVTDGDKVTTTITAITSSFQDQHDGIVNTNKDTGYMPVTVAVISTFLGVTVVVFSLHKFYLRKKGSYDTREDLKPELLQFQNL